MNALVISLFRAAAQGEYFPYVNALVIGPIMAATQKEGEEGDSPKSDFGRLRWDHGGIERLIRSIAMLK